MIAAAAVIQFSQLEAIPRFENLLWAFLRRVVSVSGAESLSF
jgi:hypothetical protein